MSESITIGLSKKQIETLLKGNALVGKRPYKGSKFHKYAKERYDGTKRIWVTMLSEEQEKQEPKEAFF